MADVETETKNIDDIADLIGNRGYVKHANWEEKYKYYTRDDMFIGCENTLTEAYQKLYVFLKGKLNDQKDEL